MNLLSNLTKKRLVDAVSMSLGTAGGQIATLVALPIISRLYTPAEFGALSIVIAASAMVLPAVSLKFEFALLIPKERRTFRGLTALALISVVFVSAAWSFSVQMFSNVVYPDSVIAHIGIWIFTTTTISGFINVFIQVAIRQREYRDIGKSTFLQSVSTGVSQSVFGLVSLNYLGLILGSIVGQLTSMLFLVVKFQKVIRRISLRELPQLFRSYWQFPAIFAPSALLNSFGTQLPFLAISSLFGLQNAGQLSMADKIVGVPISLVVASIGQIFIGEISKFRRNSDPKLTSLFIRTTFFLFIMSLLLFGLMFVLAPTVIPVILGSKWIATVPYIQILCLTAAIRMTFSPTSISLTLLEKAKTNLFLDISRVISVAIAVTFVSLSHLGMLASVLVIYGSLSLIYLLTWLVTLKTLLLADKAMNR